jgi:hypothetical protein
MPFRRRGALVPFAFAMALSGFVVWVALPKPQEPPLPVAPDLPPVEASRRPSVVEPLPLPGQLALRSERDTIAARFGAGLTDEERRRLALRAIDVQRAFLVDRPDPAEADLYRVRKGDTLGQIARRFPGRKSITGGILLLNGLRNSDILQIGRTLRVPRGRWSILVDRSLFKLYLCHRGAPFKAYRVAVGSEKSTPLAEFRVDEAVAKPMWWPPKSTGLRGPIPYGDPRNQLGEWWIGLRHNSHKGFGIHGTNAPETIETASSLGCVRMLNAEVEEVAAIAHVGMPVRTVE